MCEQGLLFLMYSAVKTNAGATRQVRRIAMNVCMDWRIGGDPHCTALTFNYDFLGDAITHLRLDLLKLHNQTMPVCTVVCNFFPAYPPRISFFFHLASLVLCIIASYFSQLQYLSMHLDFCFLCIVASHLLSACLSLSLEVSLQHFLQRGHRPNPGGCWPLPSPLLPAFSCLELKKGRSGPASLGYRRPVVQRQAGVRRWDPWAGGRIREQPGTRSWSWGEGRGWPRGF